MRTLVSEVQSKVQHDLSTKRARHDPSSGTTVLHTHENRAKTVDSTKLVVGRYQKVPLFRKHHLTDHPHFVI